MQPLTLDEIRRLPAVVDLMTAARAFGLGRTLAYELARRGDFPCEVHRIGRLYRIKTSNLLHTLDPSHHTAPVGNP
ncbi:DNA-binding protein [Frankia sp. Cas4]|uniref:DNA-binding protein n=1 Tax=Frankia sp. Cas4 TaxID=3073927 RepID=UPI002AD31664|nr:DNA-binding protein [Frankia sp. Cas4]